MKRALIFAALLTLTPLCAHAAPATGTTVLFTPVNGKEQLAYHSYGSGPIVVILNGGPGLNGLYMEPVAQTIAADGYRAILFDQRGTGASVKAAAEKEKLTTQGTIEDIEALRQQLKQDKLVFVTHSFGGAMALAYTAAHPQRVAKLILCGSTGTDLSTVGLFAKRLNERMTPEERVQYAAYNKANNDTAALNIQLLAEFDDREKAKALIKTLPQPFIYSAVSNAIGTDFSQNFHVANTINAYHGYVAVITGADDAAILMEPALIKAFPDSTVIHIAHSGHWPWLENPQQFDPALKTALATDHFAQ